MQKHQHTPPHHTTHDRGLGRRHAGDCGEAEDSTGIGKGGHEPEDRGGKLAHDAGPHGHSSRIKLFPVVEVSYHRLLQECLRASRRLQLLLCKRLYVDGRS